MNKSKWFSMWFCVLPVTLFANISTGKTAKLFGVHQVEIKVAPKSANPFDIEVIVKFTGPDKKNKQVMAFYDGNNTWKARCYIHQTGNWNWSVMSGKHGLDDKGQFKAGESKLRGQLKVHPQNSRALATDDGKWFSCIGDTGYYMFSSNNYQKYVSDNHDYGVNFIRANIFGNLRSYKDYWDGENPNLKSLQQNDQKMCWMLSNYPDMYLQFIILPEDAAGKGYFKNPVQKRTRFLHQVTARWSSFPTITWMVMNDSVYGKGENSNVVKEVTDHLIQYDHWNHLRTTGARRGKGAPFAGEKWLTLLHFETVQALAADEADAYAKFNKFPWCAEDRYETYKQPKHPRYFFRRLFWAWLLSGGSACYGGDWDAVKPYRTTKFSGLHSVKHINAYFTQRKIDLALFKPDDALGKNLNQKDKINRLQVAHKDLDEIILYHPHGMGKKKDVNVAQGKASFSLSLSRFKGTYDVEWFRPHDGESKSGKVIKGGKTITLSAPWADNDIVCRLIKK